MDPSTAGHGPFDLVGGANARNRVFARIIWQYLQGNRPILGIHTVFGIENRVSLPGFGGTSDGHGDPANQGCEGIIAAIITTRCIYIRNNMIVGCARFDSMIRLTAPMRALACEIPIRARKMGFDHIIWRRVR